MRTLYPLLTEHHQRCLEFAKYAGGCGLNLLIKIGLTMLATFWGVPLPVAYLLVHILIAILSFLYHYFVTFSRRFEGIRNFTVSFVRYLGSIVFIQLLDYLLVVVTGTWINGKLSASASLSLYERQLVNFACITGFSLILFIGRFFLYRAIFRKRNCSTKNPTI